MGNYFEIMSQKTYCGLIEVNSDMSYISFPEIKCNVYYRHHHHYRHHRPLCCCHFSVITWLMFISKICSWCFLLKKKYTTDQTILTTGNLWRDAIVLRVLPFTYWGWDKIVAILQTTFSNTFLIKVYEFRLKSHWIVYLRWQLTIFQHWFR